MNREKKQHAWWFYFWLLALLAAISLFFGPFSPSDWAFWTFDLIGLVGLWAYLRRRPVASRHLWSTYFLLAVTVTLYYGIAVVAEGTEFLALAIGVSALALAVSLPLLLALWRYAFRSPEIWGRTDAD